MGKLVRFDLAAIPAEDAGPAPDRILAGAPRATFKLAAEHEGGKLSAGLWEASPGRWRVAYTEWEFFHLLRGACELIGDDGERQVLQAGDAIVVEPGFTGEFAVLEAMAKYFVVYRPE
jgi:uncharacterized cupin superfamily protein